MNHVRAKVVVGNRGEANRTCTMCHSRGDTHAMCMGACACTRVYLVSVHGASIHDVNVQGCELERQGRMTAARDYRDLWVAGRSK